MNKQLIKNKIFALELQISNLKKIMNTKSGSFIGHGSKQKMQKTENTICKHINNIIRLKNKLNDNYKNRKTFESIVFCISRYIHGNDYKQPYITYSDPYKSNIKIDSHDQYEKYCIIRNLLGDLSFHIYDGDTRNKIAFIHSTALHNNKLSFKSEKN